MRQLPTIPKWLHLHTNQAESKQQQYTGQHNFWHHIHNTSIHICQTREYFRFFFFFWNTYYNTITCRTFSLKTVLFFFRSYWNVLYSSHFLDFYYRSSFRFVCGIFFFWFYLPHRLWFAVDVVVAAALFFTHTYEMFLKTVSLFLSLSLWLCFSLALNIFRRWIQKRRTWEYVIERQKQWIPIRVYEKLSVHGSRNEHIRTNRRTKKNDGFIQETTYGRMHRAIQFTIDITHDAPTHECTSALAHSRFTFGNNMYVHFCRNISIDVKCWIEIPIYFFGDKISFIDWIRI